MTVYTPDDLDLLFEGKPFDSIFQIFRRIWDPENKNLHKYYRDGEIESNKFEETFYKLYPKLYDELLEHCQKENTVEITRKRDRYCLVIMDSLSLREAILLERDLKDNFDTQLSYSFSTLPSETDPFKERVFNRINIAQWENPDFKYIHDLENMTVLPESNNLTVWTQVPDNKLHGSRSGHSEPWTIEEIYADTRQLLGEILATCRHNEVIVTSDHGYVDLTAGCTFAISDKMRDLFRNQFKERYREKENNFELDKLHEEKVIRYVGNYYVVQGRYSWFTGRGHVNTRKHGGLSLLECMVPVLRINKRSKSIKNPKNEVTKEN
ncbi:MAG: hypothetical protein Q7J35_03000 [Candidatus Methanoperedens sp.]|nr:hypothetical protein [Candidatus Methanoperedens sp.]